MHKRQKKHRPGRPKKRRLKVNTVPCQHAPLEATTPTPWNPQIDLTETESLQTVFIKNALDAANLTKLFHHRMKAKAPWYADMDASDHQAKLAALATWDVWLEAKPQLPETYWEQVTALHNEALPAIRVSETMWITELLVGGLSPAELLGIDLDQMYKLAIAEKTPDQP